MMPAIALARVSRERLLLIIKLTRTHTMKTTTLMIMLAALFAGGINAQDANMKRTILFTLGANEEIHYREYFVLQQVNQNRFACIIKDTAKDTYTFVFNGKRITEGRWIDIHYLNVHEESGYVIEYNLQDMGYANIKGKVYGPFDNESLVFTKNSEGYLDCDRFYYRKTEDGNRNYYIHCNGAKEGPFDNIRFPKKTSTYANSEYLYLLADRWYAHYSNGSDKMTSMLHCYTYYENGKWHVNINGRENGEYDHVFDLCFTESGKYAYLYAENGEWRVNINGVESKGYEKIHYYSLYFTESGKYAYRYRENGKEHVNINGAESRGYDEIGQYSLLTESGKHAYWYRENGKWHVNINGVESRGYDNIYYYSLRFTESGKYAFWYKENGKEHVNINGAESKGYDGIDHYSLRTKSGKYAYFYRENGKWHANINGMESKGYDNVRDLHLTESGKYAYVYTENGEEHVNINGTDKSSRGYDYVIDLELPEDGNYSFYYFNDGGKQCVNNNGKETETEYLKGMERDFFGSYNRHGNALEIYSTDREHSLYSSYKYEYVVVDGKRHGHSPALYAWYDKTKNAFVWNAVEGRELVLYEYKL
jgi:hypothetical protein